ncbi:hypothetical protein J6590_104855 [Homalodisca vitripennis]|nr:hypothetical protein J6590_104855 [Homalodisca vitripennis]
MFMKDMKDINAGDNLRANTLNVVIRAIVPSNPQGTWWIQLLEEERRPPVTRAFCPWLTQYPQSLCSKRRSSRAAEYNLITTCATMRVMHTIKSFGVMWIMNNTQELGDNRPKRKSTRLRDGVSDVMWIMNNTQELGDNRPKRKSLKG